MPVSPPAILLSHAGSFGVPSPPGASRGTGTSVAYCPGPRSVRPVRSRGLNSYYPDRFHLEPLSDPTPQNIDPAGFFTDTNAPPRTAPPPEPRVAQFWANRNLYFYGNSCDLGWSDSRYSTSLSNEDRNQRDLPVRLARANSSYVNSMLQTYGRAGAPLPLVFNSSELRALRAVSAFCRGNTLSPGQHSYLTNFLQAHLVSSAMSYSGHRPTDIWGRCSFNTHPDTCTVTLRRGNAVLSEIAISFFFMNEPPAIQDTLLFRDGRLGVVAQLPHEGRHIFQFTYLGEPETLLNYSYDDDEAEDYWILSEDLAFLEDSAAVIALGRAYLRVGEDSWDTALGETFGPRLLAGAREALCDSSRRFVTRGVHDIAGLLRLSPENRCVNFDGIHLFTLTTNGRYPTFVS